MLVEFFKTPRPMIADRLTAWASPSIEQTSWTELIKFPMIRDVAKPLDALTLAKVFCARTTANAVRLIQAGADQLTRLKDIR